MADGSLHIKLDPYSRSKLKAKAKALGVSPEALASTLLGQHLFDYDDFTWLNGDPREIDPTPSNSEGARDWEEVRPEFLALIEKAFPSG